ncbi:selenoprotein S [Silurus asotus]|uniref:Selenoprotein S n=1 Tax=Silurus asotus TaxID=30991 RepID=A0AAD5A4U9_SILAS|nr:selenoprotein S [Silurus asotus]
MEANNAGDANIRPGAGEENLENQDLSFLQAIAGAFFSQYGWFLLVLCVGVYFLIQYLSKMRPSLFQSSAPAVSQDPLSVAKREEALEASRRRMQAELDAKAAEFKEKQQRLEEEKRQQKIEMWDCVKEGKSFKGNARIAKNNEEASTSSTAMKPKADKKPLRSGGYNPLTGGGGGTCSWRPGRRGPSAGG